MNVSVNGKLIGHVSDVGFMRAFLKVWLGDKPAQADLKDRLMGLDLADAK
jgi:long-chain acyl-CoA synthetase